MADQNINNMSRTWASGGTTFDAIKMNITDAASDAASTLLLLQVGGTDKFKVGKDGSVAAAGVVKPSANDGAALGASGTAWSDLFLASGGVLNFAAGNWVATHSSGILTVGTGDLRVTTAGTNSASVVTVSGTQTLTNKSIVATQLTGTVASARISGSYTGITGVGALDAGSITSNFGSINIGSSSLTANDVRASAGIFSAASGSPSTLTFRPTAGSSSGQMTIDTSGNASVAGTLTAAGGVVTVNGSSTVRYDATSSGGVTARLLASTVGVVGTSSNHDLRLITNDTTRATIAAVGGIILASGNDLTLTSGDLDVGGDVTVAGTTTIATAAAPGAVMTVENTNGNATMIQFKINGSNIGSILGSTSGGGLVQIASASDRSIKINDRDFDSGAIMDGLHFIEYDVVPERGGGRGRGVIAQEAEKVVPEMVINLGGGLKGFAYPDLIPIFGREIKDLRRRMAALEARPH